MMKKTQRIDAHRNILREKVAFFSIMFISLLAAASFLGLSFSGEALRRDAVRYFNRQGFWDLEITSTMLMTVEDLQAIRQIPGVREAEPVWETEGLLIRRAEDVAVTVISRPGNISRPVLLEGRLPEKAQECAVEKNLAESCGLAVGQEITVKCQKLLDTDPLRETVFIITGVFHTPDHLSYLVPEEPYVMVKEDAFSLEDFKGAFMKARIRVSGAPEARYSDEYREAVRPVAEALEALGEERAALRTREVRGSLEQLIREGEEKLTSARAEREDFLRQLEDGQKKLTEAGERLGLIPGALDTADAMLQQGSQQLETVMQTLRDYGVQISDSYSEVERLNDFARILDNASLFLERIRPGVALSQDDLDFLRGTLLFQDPMTVPEWLDLLGEIFEDTPEIGEMRSTLAQARSGIDVYLAARNDYYYAGEQYLDDLTAVEKGLKALEEGRRRLAEIDSRIEEAEKALRQAREKAEQLGECHWVVLTDDGNAGFVYGKLNAARLTGLSLSFSTVFLFVGALVVYATISRMVEEQGRQIGLNRALGLYRREILRKYLRFGLRATLLGVGLSIPVAWLPLQRTILNSFEAYLSYGKGSKAFLPAETVAVSLGALAIALLAVCLGCSQLFRRSPLALLQGVQPQVPRRKKSRRSGKRGLFFRTVVRNMRVDWVRVFVTTVSIAGGCALMVAGFTLRYGISGIPDRQFGQIQNYDARVLYTTGQNPDAAAEIAGVLEREGLSYRDLHQETLAFEMDGGLTPMTLIAVENGVLDGFFRLRDAESGETLSLQNSGAVVPRRFAEYYGFDVGETISAYNTALTPVEFPVNGIFENYYGRFAFMSPAAYEEIFGAAPQNNCFFVKLEGMSIPGLEDALEHVEGYVRVENAVAERVLIDRFTASLNYVVYLMLFLACMMVGFIVANFNVTFIRRKNPELTIMRVNGFTTGECVRYVAGDLIITTLLGTAAGLAAGGILGRSVLRIVETPYVQMIRDTNPKVFILSAVFTVCFSAVTNALALRRIRYLKLADINR